MNIYTPEEVKLLKEMIDEADLRGPFSCPDRCKPDIVVDEKTNEIYYPEEDHSYLQVGNIFCKQEVSLYDDPIRYLKYIVITTSEIALNNSGKDGTDGDDTWKGYLDWYEFIFYVPKEDIPLYVNTLGLEVPVSWRTKIGK
jgi:hypothetical protein